ncbi:recombinase family protein [Muricoccus radiodurans]|uniref:recombinase family protein n=1 Tax=Muricoccus radiodurans TaxID=2231721 RepID=UPI003CEAA1D8
MAARLDRITRRAHTLSGLLEEGISIRAADMPGADDLMMRVYAAMAQKERELISERTRATLAAARARGAVLGGDRWWRPPSPPCAQSATQARRGGSGARSTPVGVGDREAQVGGYRWTGGAGTGAQRARGADAGRTGCVDAYDGRAGAMQIGYS